LTHEFVAYVPLVFALVILNVLEAAVIAAELLVVNPTREEQDEGHQVEKGVLEALT
jgi:hypothetical protein